MTQRLAIAIIVYIPDCKKWLLSKNKHLKPKFRNIKTFIVKTPSTGQSIEATIRKSKHESKDYLKVHK